MANETVSVDKSTKQRPSLPRNARAWP
jgi:hypothetical protein